MAKTVVHVHLPDTVAPDEAAALAAQVAPNALSHREGDIIRGPSGAQYRVTKVERVTRVAQPA